MVIATVYVHINKINGKKYFGITSRDVETRWMKGHGYAKHLPIRRAFDKYGWDNFEHIILHTDLTEQEAKRIEQELIFEYQTQDSRFGYNITAGGDGVKGWHPSDETKEKIRKSAKTRIGEKNPNFNHKWTQEMREKSALKHKRENLTQETIAKMSKSAQHRNAENNPFYGKKHSPETKQLISEKQSRPVYMFDLDGNFMNEFKSIKTASKETGINKVAISNCCRGCTKTSGGYKWRYKDSCNTSNITETYSDSTI